MQESIEAYKERRQKRLEEAQKVNEFRDRRSKRLDSRSIDDWRERRAIRLLERMDADDDGESNSNNSGGKSGGHGNMRIPFGLCQREGIEIGKGWTPFDAWSALGEKGIRPSEVYRNLKTSGKVSGGSKTQQTISARKQKVSDLKKAKEELKSIEKDISDYSRDHLDYQFTPTRSVLGGEKEPRYTATVDKDTDEYRELSKKKEECESKIKQIEDDIEKGKSEYYKAMMEEHPNYDKLKTSEEVGDRVNASGYFGSKDAKGFENLSVDTAKAMAKNIDKFFEKNPELKGKIGTIEIGSLRFGKYKTEQDKIVFDKDACEDMEKGGPGWLKILESKGVGQDNFASYGLSLRTCRWLSEQKWLDGEPIDGTLDFSDRLENEVEKRTGRKVDNAIAPDTAFIESMYSPNPSRDAVEAGKIIKELIDKNIRNSRADSIDRFHKRRAIRLLSRMDDEEDNTGGGGRKSGGHGNTKIPFGLCLREGIAIEENWGPAEAWKALEEKGIKPSAVYSELKKRGSISGNKGKSVSKATEFRKKMESAKQKIKAIKVVDVDKLDKEIEVAFRKWNKTYEKKGMYEYKVEKADEQINKLKTQHKGILKQYGGEKTADIDKMELLFAEAKECESKLKKLKRGDEEYNRLMDWLTDNGTSKEIAKDIKFEKSYSEQMAEMEKKKADAIKGKEKYDSEGLFADYKKKKHELEEKIAAVFEKQQEAINEYKGMLKDYLDNSPDTKSVQKNREIEQDIKHAQEKVDQLFEKIKDREGMINKAEQMISVLPKGSVEDVEDMVARWEVEIMDLESEMERNKREIGYLELQKETKPEGEDEKNWDMTYDVANEYDVVPQLKQYKKLNRFADIMERRNVDYNPVYKYAKPCDENMIIERLGGGDKTGGSCASLALAYIANKAGYDVLDFRDGMSREFFAGGLSGKGEADMVDFIASSSFIPTLAGIDGKDCASLEEEFKSCEVGKEYLLSAASHAAIVRKNEWGNMEYLELQSETNNGWKTMDSQTFRWRFKVDNRSRGLIVETNKLVDDDGEFLSFMGYINTPHNEQVKGERGHEK